jgi:hypothetical protein
MALDVGRFSVFSIVPRGGKAIMVALLRNRWKIRRWRRFNISRVRMRTSG